MIEITVSEVLEEVKEYQEEFSPEGLCIYFAHLLYTIYLNYN